MSVTPPDEEEVEAVVEVDEELELVDFLLNKSKYAGTWPRIVI